VGAPTGLVGKLPAHGDFVRRGGPAPVLAALDEWLDRELSLAPDLAERRDALDGWRFAARVAGHDVLGAMVASVDAVGREFPLVAVLSPGAAVAFEQADAWCTGASEALAQARDGGLRADAVTVALAEIATPARGAEGTGGWWRTGDAAPTGEPELPVGPAFAVLFAEATA